ncbi:MAG TPA: SRPBCC family protein [Azonexus sp.]
MQFEHLIAINDPGNPLIMPLSRQQLWAGLLQRVENPLPFLPGLEACTILERHADHLVRELDFGAARIRDRVTHADAHWVRFDIEPNDQHAGGSLTITIEEPEAGHLFLRFAYVTGFAAAPGSEDRAYVEYIKSAYQQSDIDCVRIIRTLATGDTPQ